MTTKQTQKKTPVKKTTSKKAPIHARVKGHAKHVLVPHKANEYRPHLIRLHGLVAVLVIALVAQLVYSVMTTGHLSVLGRTADIQTAELLTDTNTERQKAGVPALEISAPLSEAAFLKAQDMLKEQYWAHVSPSGTQPWKWFGDVGYNYSSAGENLAKNYPTAQATIDAWMNSPAHRENVLRQEYKDVGFAVVEGQLNGEETTLVVALYGAPVNQATVSAVVQPQAAGFASAEVKGAQAPWAYFASALESLSPVTVVILGLFAVVAIIGVIAHHNRAKLPKAWKKSWRIHHGLFTFVGMIVLGVLVIVATGGGSI